MGFFNILATNLAKNVCLEYLEIVDHYLWIILFSNINFMSWYLPNFSEDTLNFLHSDSVTFLIKTVALLAWWRHVTKEFKDH